MKTITQQIDIYTFDELSDKAKDRVKQWADTFEFSAESTIYDFKTIAKIIGFYDIDTRYSGFWSQGDGASFTGRYKYAKGAAKLIREYAPLDVELHRIVDGLQSIQRNNFYRLRAILTPGANSNHYSHENTISFELYDYDNEYKHISQEDDFKEVCRDLMRWLYSALESNYAWCNSDEYISEHCDSNEYQFDINGGVI